MNASPYRQNVKDIHSVAVRGKTGDFYHEGGFLEWVFKIPSGLLRYVLLNKVKALVYGLILIFMIYFIVTAIRSVIHKY